MISETTSSISEGSKRLKIYTASASVVQPAHLLHQFLQKILWGRILQVRAPRFGFISNCFQWLGVLQRKKSTVPEWNCQPWSPVKVPAEKCRFSSDFVVSSSHAVTLAILIQLMYIIFLCTYTCGFESWRQNLVRVKNHELRCTLRSISNLRPFRSSNPRSKALATGSVKLFWHVSIPIELRNGKIGVSMPKLQGQSLELSIKSNLYLCIMSISCQDVRQMSETLKLWQISNKNYWTTKNNKNLHPISLDSLVTRDSHHGL